MLVASNQGTKQPVVVSIDSSDDKKLKTVKTLINKMVVKEPNQRMSAKEVVKALESVAGTCIRLAGTNSIDNGMI